MPRRFGTDAEFDALVASLSERDDVRNPYAVANLILRRKYGGNPGLRWRMSDTPGGWLTESHGARFELRPSSTDGLDADPGWVGWELDAGGDVVARFLLPHDEPDAAMAVADGWVAAWSHEWD